ncbi:MAG TPA: hypothetical protein VLT33_26960 [Labilithrix sp.]|nr:hypothetical protein [Labilithrix sp.]
MKQRVRGIQGHRVQAVSTWQACATPPSGARAGSGEPQAPLEAASLAWGAPVETTAPTAAAMLRAAGTWSLDAPARRFDAEDWWFRAQLPDRDLASGDELVLAFDGLATVADVWLDGVPLLASDNMFLRHERVLATAGRELVICCRSLDARLAARRPRPRWRAPMIDNQQLRWFRTTLLGRTPGWSPPAAVVGPWAGVRLEQRRDVAIDDVHLGTAIHGTTGVVGVTCRARSLGAFAIARVELILEREGRELRSVLEKTDDGSFAGQLSIPDVTRWWPHTHGDPALYAARLSISGSGESSVMVDLGKVGFREIAQYGDFSISVNGVPVFCRGACWTPLDVVTLRSGRDAYERALHQARDAGMNMLRVGGTMVYESDDFYDLADELGILLWHDFMFANMDYPEDDAAFGAGVAEEARQFLARLEGRPSLAVLCGNSEVEQQAAMFGAPRERWSPKLFHETLAGIAKELRPDVPYWPSSAHGGAFPHEARTGTTSYYGVGAYLRPLEDARRSEVRFATECLAFANVPAEAPAQRHAPPYTRAALLARTPRDLGAGWDFADVRDHYVRSLFGVDPAALRYGDPDRYLELGRAATAEVIAATFGEWRRADSRCRGALVWFFRDLWEGAGWGVVGADGTPKSPWWTMRRACAPVAVHLSDEGGNGLYVHLVNDGPEAVDGELELSLFRAGEVAVGTAKRAVEIAHHSALSLAAASLFEGFLDLTHAYRFGPPTCDLVVATLRLGATSLRAFHFPLGLPSTRELDLGLVAEARPRPDGDLELTLRTRRFAQSLVIDAEGFTADDAWFHLPPGGERSLLLRRAPGSGAAVLKGGTVRALNGEPATKIVVSSS